MVGKDTRGVVREKSMGQEDVRGGTKRGKGGGAESGIGGKGAGGVDMEVTLEVEQLLAEEKAGIGG